MHQTPETLKLLEGNVEETLKHACMNNEFLKGTLIT